ncbi:MAG: hypothetical protein GY920_06135 [Aliivibrio sp.]|nr:hypothetical protein [Aliivibrio sp.]
MALIPLNQQFHTQSGDVDTSNKGSRLANADRKSFTMQDIIDTASLSGTNTVYVKADGTPQENGVALLKGYEEAKTKVSTYRTTIQGSTSNLGVLCNILYFPQGYAGLPTGVWQYQALSGFMPTDFPVLPVVGQTYTGQMTYSTTAGKPNRVTATVVVQDAIGGILPGPGAQLFYAKMYDEDGNEIVGTDPNTPGYEPFDNFGGGLYLIDVPVAANLVIEPGIYEINTDWIIDGLVNVTSSTGQSDVIIQGADIKITAGSDADGVDITINGLSTVLDDVQTTGYDFNQAGLNSYSIYIGSQLERLTVSNCTAFGLYSFGIDPDETGIIDSNFINCKASGFSFGSGLGNSIGGFGTFENCSSKWRSFGWSTTQIRGSFNNCRAAGTQAFGYLGLDVGGSYDECYGSDDSFGSEATEIYFNTSFNSCTGGNDSFGHNVATDNGGLYRNCTGGNNSFTSSHPTNKGEYFNCKGGSNSFRNSGTTILSKSLYECTTSGVPTIGDGSKVWNSIANDWTVSGTGQVTNCLKTADWTSVTLP